jgi:hypothetical protein
MLRFLFWNYRYNGPDREELLARLVQSEAVDILILAESSIVPDELVGKLSSRGRRFSTMPIPHDSIQVYAGFSPDAYLDWVGDVGRLCLRRFQAPGHPEIILGSLHLASGLHLERTERKTGAGPLARAVREAQHEFGHARAVVVGDFNLNPYEDGMIFSDGFGAMTTKSLVKKYALYHGDRYSRFYNPIWSRMGREATEGPPGTYYWESRRDLNIYWNFIDQVLVGHDLLDHFPDHRFRILTAIPGAEGSHSLIRETERHWNIEVSDHLPILFDLDLLPEDAHA